MYTRIKNTLICKEVKNFTLNEDLVRTYTPKAGDVAVFEIMKVGRHIKIQSETKRDVQIIEGDHILAAFANRYATEQFEGYVPDVPTELLHILGAGGAVGVVKSKNSALKHIEPTLIKLIAYAVNEDREVINTKYTRVKVLPFTGSVPNKATVILSVGSSMDSGKTTTAAYLARGLKTTGKKIAFIKLTGTGYTKDKDLVYDCGADVTIDFTDAGFPSTYMCAKQELLDLYQTLLSRLEPEKPDYIIIELADGILERETEFLLRDDSFMCTVSKVVFSSSDSMAAFFGIHFLEQIGIAPVAVGGKFTMSPLLIKEVKDRSAVPVLTIEELMSGDFVHLFNKPALASR
ncbi:MAG: hypothetical protein ACHQRM_04960 [Bacteroidia bacterium]